MYNWFNYIAFENDVIVYTSLCKLKLCELIATRFARVHRLVLKTEEYHLVCERQRSMPKHLISENCKTFILTKFNFIMSKKILDYLPDSSILERNL